MTNIISVFWNLIFILFQWWVGKWRCPDRMNALRKTTSGCWGRGGNHVPITLFLTEVGVGRGLGDEWVLTVSIKSSESFFFFLTLLFCQNGPTFLFQYFSLSPPLLSITFLLASSFLSLLSLSLALPLVYLFMLHISKLPISLKEGLWMMYNIIGNKSNNI